MSNIAESIYSKVKDYSGLQEISFCDVHQCGEVENCQNHQAHPGLNFDIVKEKYCLNNNQSSLASVDLLTYNSTGILFLVEAKGWNLYLKFSRPKSISQVKQKVSSYNFTKKLFDSLTIIKDIAIDPNGNIEVPIVYIVVSDFQHFDAISEFSNMLEYLANTSSMLGVEYGNAISASLSHIEDVNCDYVPDCRNVDEVIKEWKSARTVVL